MIQKLVSSKAILAKVMSDLALTEKGFPISDCRLWIGEGMMQIGSVNQMDHKVVVLPFKGYQCALPCDMESLNSVAFSTCDCGGWIPMKKSTGTFSVYTKKKGCDDCNMLIHDDVLIPLVKSMYNIIDDKEALEKLNTDKNMRQTLSALVNLYTVCTKNGMPNHIGIGDTNFSPRPQYDIKPGYLIFNVPAGFIKVSYNAIYTDEDGMPLIPDHQAYHEALFWYVALKLLYTKYVKGKVARQVWADALSSWNYYRKQAYAASLMPNIDDMTNIKNTWQTLVPEIDEESTFFSVTGDRQRIHNANDRFVWY